MWREVFQSVVEFRLPVYCDFCAVQGAGRSPTDPQVPGVKDGVKDGVKEEVKTGVKDKVKTGVNNMVKNGLKT